MLLLEYGKYLISELSKKFSEEFGKGFSKRNLEQMRQFYITYSIAQTVPAQLKLSWSHYLVLMRVNDINELNFYEIESLSNNWNLRELDRQINSSLFERLSLSKEKEMLLFEYRKMLFW